MRSQVGGCGTVWAQGGVRGEATGSSGMMIPCCCRHLSPRAIQVLRGLEPHQTRRNIFMFLAENNRRRQEQQRQFCRSLQRDGKRQPWGIEARSEGCLWAA